MKPFFISIFVLIGASLFIIEENDKNLKNLRYLVEHNKTIACKNRILDNPKMNVDGYVYQDNFIFLLNDCWEFKN